MKKKLLLVSDTTGSMSPVIKSVRDNLVRLTKDVADGFDFETEIGVLFHGDWVDCPKSISWSGWHKPIHVDKLINFISGTSGTFGGDAPEFYEQVLAVINKDIDWSEADTKVVVMVGDVYPHGYPNRNRGNLSQNAHHGYKLSEKHAFYGRIADWKEEAGAIAAQGIVLHAVHARGTSTDFWYDLAEAGQGAYLSLNQFHELHELVLSSFAATTDRDGWVVATDSLSPGDLSRAMAASVASLLSWAGEGEKAKRFDSAVGRRDLMGRGRPSEAGSLAARRPRTYRSSVDEGALDAKHKALDERHFLMLEVTREDLKTCRTIRDIVLANGLQWKQGNAFYELGGQKRGQIVQERKQVVVYDKSTGDMFSGSDARNLIGLPYGERGKISPRIDGNANTRVFIQSTSYNRKPIAGSWILYKDPGL